MDHIRKALDRARLERAGTAEVHPLDEERTKPAEPAPSTLPATIVYTRTRIVQPSPAVLERNRIIRPGSPGPAAAAYRMLRTQVLQRMKANDWRSVAVFSPRSTEGKTTTAINLAMHLASDRQHTVLLVEFDFRRPSLAAKLGLAPEFGADDLLCGTARIEDCLYHPEGFDRLVVLPARSTLVQSSEALVGPQARRVVGELHARYSDRLIVYDLPPVLEADDALAFAPLVECGLVVAAEGRTARGDFVRTIELLHKTPLVGTVLNRAAEASAGY
ncbi:MAG: CpsD/CapB family tyrosine-protein kinase [Gammaproteobacteria bacterium]|nr:CpsD/CapB family tyrosine-protein kinase [Gammaproteobacteria bacterium]